MTILISIQLFVTPSDLSKGLEPQEIGELVFPHDEVLEVNIAIDEQVYAEMIENATDETLVMADITYNGQTLQSVGIRPKGNSSLRDVANQEGDRFSFKIDFNEYIEDQTLYGLTKLNLNNLFMDPSMMAEYLAYEMLETLDADAPRTTYVRLSINGDYFGLYLAVEEVNDAFLIAHYGNAEGQLYKPDMGQGADLVYTSDEASAYAGLFTDSQSDQDVEQMVALLKAIETGESLKEVFHVESFLKYLAMSTFTVHLDSYQGSMFHNYYLYDDQGVFEWITWDLNMIFNGFPGSSLTDTEATQFLIDEPVKGAMSSYPLVDVIMSNASYVETYHDYLTSLLEAYGDPTTFEAHVMSIYDMIKASVQEDPSSFYTYEAFEEAVFGQGSEALSLLTFVEQRSASIQAQLTGQVASTNNGNGNSGTGQARGQKPGGMGLADQQAPVTEAAMGQDPQANLVQGQTAQGERPQGDRPAGAKPNGQNPTGNLPPQEGMENQAPKTTAKEGLYTSNDVSGVSGTLTNNWLTTALASILLLGASLALKFRHD